MSNWINSGCSSIVYAVKKLTIQSFLQQNFFNYQRRHNMPLYQLKAVERLMCCRTAALGGHAVYCENGHLNGVWYNSCKHRSCPQCNALTMAQWQQKAEALMLACQHHHWVFTLPHDLHAIWQYNRAFCQQLLFRSVKDTLKMLSHDVRYLGATPGCILALHTWARNQMFHPHIHCVISHGGLDGAGQWQTPKRASFLPAKVMMQLFRGKYLDGIKKALQSGELVVPKAQRAQQVVNLCHRLGRKDWVVHCAKPYAHGRGVANYLARYIRGGALKNTQIVSIGEQSVKFRYKSHQSQQLEYRSLSHEQFMQQVLSHIAIPRKAQYQLLGLYHGRCRAKLDEAKQHLGQLVSEPPLMNWQVFLEDQGKLGVCEQCGKYLSQLRKVENTEEFVQLSLSVSH
jgi:hypothetical protein